MSVNYPAPDYDLAIVGAGFSGSMVAMHAMSAARGPLTIALINKSVDFGRGIAYGTRCPAHLLNVPAGRMSAFVDDPDHFYRWIAERQFLCTAYGITDARREQFLPRALFGRYVSDLLEERHRAAPAGVLVKKIIADVPDIQECPGGMRVWLDEQESITARKVVLAPGNFPPGDPPLKNRRFYHSPNYLGTPWKEENLQRLRDAREVLVLGSGLTAVDLVLTLREEGVAERIHLLSRRGLLPQAHRAAAPYPGFVGESRPSSVRQLMRLVRAEIRRAEAQDIDWRPVLDSLRPVTSSLWQGLDLANQRRFLRHARVYWETHRHRVAPQLLADIQLLADEGRLVRHRGRIETMERTETGRARVVHLPKETGGERREIEVDLVVNCTGPESNYRKLNDPLILNLLARGLIHPDPLFMGLDVAADGAAVSVEGNYSSALYTLGSARRGQLFESTAVPELRAQAQQLAVQLVRDLQPPTPSRETAAFEI